MADWTQGMTRTYEYWRVNPDTWGDVELLDIVTGCTITRDSDEETLGHATFEMDSWGSEDGVWDSERIIRVYLITVQDGVRERWPLGTYLVQAPSMSFDGARGSVTADGYTPLKMLADDNPPDYYSVESGNVASRAASLIETNSRVRVIEPDLEGELTEEYVADDGSWLDFIKGLLAKGRARMELTPRGEVVFAPIQDSRSLAPSRRFDDGNSSILLPEAEVSSNLIEVPNVVRVVYSEGSRCLASEAVNSDPAHPNSTVNVGRRKVYRETSPDLPDNPTQEDVDAYARKLLRNNGAANYEVTFSHGFVPDVVLGTAVRLAYSAMGVNVVAQVVSQTIECTPACTVSTTARYTKQEVV